MTMGTPAEASIPATGTWKIDGVHSTATFKVTHNVVATFRGTFHGVNGSLENGVLAGEVAVEGLEIGPLEPFKQHLLSADWFDAAAHPALSFRSTDLHSHADGTLHAAGELTMKGVTKPVSISGSVVGPQEVTAVDNSVATRLGVNLATTVDRREFGLESFGGANWDVTLEVALELVAE
jgi:polyisoprenoid-binding protein YceI